MEKTEDLETIVPILLRQTVAHVLAITFVGYAITVGVVVLERGMTSISTAVEPSLWFLAALLALSVISLPAGLFLRFLCGKILVRPIVCIFSIGFILGLSLIPVVHPELTDERIVVEEYRAELFLIHGIAGILGGALWWLIEFKIMKKRVT